MDNKKTFAEIIEEKRQELGLTIAEFCKQLKISNKTYFLWKEGKGPRESTKMGVLKALEEMVEPSTGLVMLDCMLSSTPKDKLFTVEEARMLAKNIFFCQRITDKDKPDADIPYLERAQALSATTNISSRKYNDISEFIEKDVAFLDWKDFLAFIRKVKELAKK